MLDRRSSARGTVSLKGPSRLIHSPRQCVISLLLPSFPSSPSSPSPSSSPPFPFLLPFPFPFPFSSFSPFPFLFPFPYSLSFPSLPLPFSFPQYGSVSGLGVFKMRHIPTSITYVSGGGWGWGDIGVVLTILCVGHSKTDA